MKHIYFILCMIGFLISLLDWLGISQNIIGEFILPYPYVRMPVVLISVISLFLFWRNAQYTKATIDNLESK